MPPSTTSFLTIPLLVLCTYASVPVAELILITGKKLMNKNKFELTSLFSEESVKEWFILLNENFNTGIYSEMLDVVITKEAIRATHTVPCSTVLSGNATCLTTVQKLHPKNYSGIIKCNKQNVLLTFLMQSDNKSHFLIFIVLLSFV